MADIEFRPTDISVLVIGDVMLDRYVYGTVTRVSPEDPTCLVLEHEPPVERRVGGAANVAFNLAALGVKVDLVGLTGSGKQLEQFKSAMQHQLETIGRNADMVTMHLVESDRPFTIKTRYCFKDKQLLRVDHEDCLPQSTSECEQLTEAAENVVCSPATAPPHLTILSDYAKGTLDTPFLNRLVFDREPNMRGLLASNEYVVDPKRKKLDDYGYPLAVCPNEHEFRDVRERTEHAKYVVVTRGMNGCVVYSDSCRSRFEVPSPGAVEICDPTGAGDTFIAALTTALAMKRDIKEACWIANTAARRSVLVQGTTAVSWPDIEEDLKKFGRTMS